MSVLSDEIHYPVIKVATAITAPVAAVGLTEAATMAALIASSLAAIYTTVLLSEWLWKRLLKPLAVRMGWFGYRKSKDRQ